MALIDFSNTNKTKESAESVVNEFNTDFWHYTRAQIEKAISKDQIIEGNSIVYVSKGNWSMHDLLLYFLQITGKASVFITSWAISEIAMRQLFSFKQNGLIHSLNLVLDYRNKVRKEKELAFVNQFCDAIALKKIHSKVTVIQNENYNISIIGSANYTRNPRYESGVILISKSVADFNIKWIQELL